MRRVVVVAVVFSYGIAAGVALTVGAAEWAVRRQKRRQLEAIIRRNKAYRPPAWISHGS